MYTILLEKTSIIPKSVEKHDMGLSNSKTSWEAWDQTSNILYNDYMNRGAHKAGLNVQGGNDRRKALPKIENNPFTVLSQGIKPVVYINTSVNNIV